MMKIFSFSVASVDPSFVVLDDGSLVFFRIHEYNKCLFYRVDLLSGRVLASGGFVLNWEVNPSGPQFDPITEFRVTGIFAGGGTLYAIAGEYRAMLPGAIHVHRLDAYTLRHQGCMEIIGSSGAMAPAAYIYLMTYNSNWRLDGDVLWTSLVGSGSDDLLVASLNLSSGVIKGVAEANEPTDDRDATGDLGYGSSNAGNLSNAFSDTRAAVQYSSYGYKWDDAHYDVIGYWKPFAITMYDYNFQHLSTVGWFETQANQYYGSGCITFNHDGQYLYKAMCLDSSRCCLMKITAQYSPGSLSRTLTYSPPSGLTFSGPTQVLNLNEYLIWILRLSDGREAVLVTDENLEVAAGPFKWDRPFYYTRVFYDSLYFITAYNGYAFGYLNISDILRLPSNTSMSRVSGASFFSQKVTNMTRYGMDIVIYNTRTETTPLVVPIGAEGYMMSALYSVFSPGHISGTILKSSLPGSGVVYAFDSATGTLSGQTATLLDGTFDIVGLYAGQEYNVIAYSSTGERLGSYDHVEAVGYPDDEEVVAYNDKGFDASSVPDHSMRWGTIVPPGG